MKAGTNRSQSKAAVRPTSEPEKQQGLSQREIPVLTTTGDGGFPTLDGEEAEKVKAFEEDECYVTEEGDIEM